MSFPRNDAYIQRLIKDCADRADEPGPPSLREMIDILYGMDKRVQDSMHDRDVVSLLHVVLYNQRDVARCLARMAESMST